MKEIVEKYKEHLIVSSNSYATIDSYTRKINSLLEAVPLDKLSTETIRSYLLTLENKLTPSSINVYKSAFKSFTEFIERFDIHIPKSAKLGKKLPQYFTLEFFEESIIPITELVFRNPFKIKTLLYFMFYSGLRVGDIAKLHRADFNLENKTVRVYNKKNKQERIIPFPAKIEPLLEVYFESEPEIKSAFNFSKKGIQSLLSKLNTYFKDVNIHAHTFRHSSATYMRKSGMKIEDIQYILGHININSTMIYAHADNRQLINEYHKKVK